MAFFMQQEEISDYTVIALNKIFYTTKFDDIFLYSQDIHCCTVE